MHINSIKAAASPSKRRSMGADGTPRTPRSAERGDLGSPSLAIVGGSAVTPMKRVPILANFEEWMKMATDNKINATNSWNFALIDYFHDMSLLKEGDSVNFQKASCTLDGCVKIYTSRVDSVATETGKLLSGLADSGNKKGKKDNEEDGDQEEGEDEDGEDGANKKSRKKVQRSSEATLVSSFAQLQLKKMELEFSVDPLFKKASADFDEGGAKGLLLNHLTIDDHGRIVFDSSDNIEDREVEEDDETEQAEGDVVKEDNNADNSLLESNVDLQSLASRFFPDLSRLDEQEVCPSLKTFELGGASDTIDIPFLKAADDWKKEAQAHKGAETSSDMDAPMGNFGGMDDYEDNEGFQDGLGMSADIAFGEGGEAWAKEAAIDARPRAHNSSYDNDSANQGLDDEDQMVGAFDASGGAYGVKLASDREFNQENVLSYFDEALRRNWAGPEHWRIRKFKDFTKPAAPTAKRKEKEPFEIDFLAPLTPALVDTIYTLPSSNAAICLPRSQWKSASRNLLPDDKHFDSKQFLRLFLKPKARIGTRRLGPGRTTGNDEIPRDPDAAFWANQRPSADENEGNEGQGQYDANFFQDDGLGLPHGLADDDDEVFADALEALGPAANDAEASNGTNSQEAGATNGFGTQLVAQSRRIRPEYVQYARVAKKVDVRRLKEEMWRGLGFDEVSALDCNWQFADIRTTAKVEYRG